MACDLFHRRLQIYSLKEIPWCWTYLVFPHSSGGLGIFEKLVWILLLLREVRQKKPKFSHFKCLNINSCVTTVWIKGLNQKKKKSSNLTMPTLSTLRFLVLRAADAFCSAAKEKCQCWYSALLLALLAPLFRLQNKKRAEGGVLCVDISHEHVAQTFRLPQVLFISHLL